MSRSIGIFGGTFDPIHIGHLRTALELREYLQLDEMRLLPCADPPHRQSPLASAEHRLEMVERAIAEEDGLLVDDRELRRSGPSYSIDTLRELRRELGDQVCLCLCIGMDSLLSLDSWRCWQALTDYAHIVVAARPGWHMPTRGSVADWLNQHLLPSNSSERAAPLLKAPSGNVLFAEMTLLPVAARDVRAAIAGGKSVRYLVPDKVIEYIHEHKLY